VEVLTRSTSNFQGAIRSTKHFLAANVDENEDLFWGLRGGSSNFGIVTSLEYRLFER
jgi:hypothetical protein